MHFHALVVLLNTRVKDVIAVACVITRGLLRSRTVSIAYVLCILLMRRTVHALKRDLC